MKGKEPGALFRAVVMVKDESSRVPGGHDPMKVLVINSGSSSMKYKLYDTASEVELATGLIERMNQPEATIIHRVNGRETRLTEPVADAEKGVSRAIELLMTVGNPPPLSDSEEIMGVGHRVVHGGEAFSASAVVDDEVLAAIEQCVPLAPLQNPANLAGLRAAMKILPSKPQVAVFDTAFFQTMPPAAYHYALCYEWYERHRIRRYGFHGSSHRYVTTMAADLLGKPDPNLITLHLGNGCSMACIREGKAIDQTMGLTPLEGLVMGTRSGDFDPGIIFHLLRQGLDIEEIRTGGREEERSARDQRRVSGPARCSRGRGSGRQKGRPGDRDLRSSDA